MIGFCPASEVCLHVLGEYALSRPAHDRGNLMVFILKSQPEEHLPNIQEMS